MRLFRPTAVRLAAAALLLLGLLASPLAEPSAQTSADDQEAVSSLVLGLLEQLDSADAQSDVTLAALQNIAADEGLSQASREQVLHDFALALREQPDSTAGRHALRWLTGYQSQVYVQHEERGPATIPLWRVAGVAQGTLTLWDRADTGSAARQLRAGATDLAGAMARATSVQDALALQEAMKLVSPAELAPHRESLLAMLATNDAMAPAVAEAALQLQDAELSRAVLASGDRRTAARHIAGIGARLPSATAFALLRDASADSELASAAIIEIGKSASALPAARAFLLEALGDPEHGASAAAALAGMRDDEMVQAVSAELESSDDQTLQSQAALMLALDGSPLARESLRKFTLRRDVSRELRQELSIWLQESVQ